MNRARWTAVLLAAGFAVALSIFAQGSPDVARATHSRSTSLSLKQLLHPAFTQPRLQIDERIVTDPLIHQEFRIRWIAPNRLRTDVYGTNLHVGKVGCILGNFWVCGPDSAPHGPELQQITLYSLFPQQGNNGYCCLKNLHVQAATSPNTYTITAVGDPWLYPLGCQGCDLPGSPRRPVSSEHYRATLVVDADRRPVRLTSTITFDSVTTPKGKLPGSETRAQVAKFSYSGTWTLDVPQGKRFPCPSWDQTPGSWCVENR